jgi:hypothetical protein
MPMPRFEWSRSPDAVTVRDGTVVTVFNSSDGELFSLNEEAGFVWSLLSPHEVTTGANIAAQYAASFVLPPVRAEADCMNTLAELHRLGLAVMSEMTDPA